MPSHPSRPVFALPIAALVTLVALVACVAYPAPDPAPTDDQLDAAVGDGGMDAPGQPPAPPTGLATATLTPSTGKLRLVWSPSVGATSYQLKRAASRAGGYAFVATVMDPTYTDTGLVDGTTSYYRVSALNTAGESADSMVLAAVPKDAGLTDAFVQATAVGTRRDATTFGATPNLPSDDDAIAINAAIDAAASDGGGEVYLPTGVYHVRGTITLAANVTLRGASSSESILRASHSTAGNVIVNVPAGQDNVILSTFRVDRDEASPIDVIGEAVRVGSSSSGADLERVLVEHLEIEGFDGRAINLRRVHHVLVRDNVIRNATNLGGGGHGYGIVLNDSTNHDNQVSGNWIGPGIRHGVILQFQAHHNLVEDNTCGGTSEDAYDLHGEDEYSNELRDNKAFGGARSGFGVGNTGATHANSGPNNWIHHNEVWGSQSGINLILKSNDQFIEDNDLHDNDSDGITFHTSGADRVKLLRNRATGNGRDGLRAETSLELRLEENVFTGNTGHGVFLADPDCNGFTIVDNDLRDNAAGPKDLGGSMGAYVGNLE